MPVSRVGSPWPVKLNSCPSEYAATFHRMHLLAHGGERASRVRPADADQLIGLGVRQRRQQNSIDQAENRGIRADAQRQRQHRNYGKARRSSQGASAVTQILRPSFQESHAPRVPAFFFGSLHSAKLQASLAQRFRARQAAADEILRAGFDVETEFGVHFGFHAGAQQRAAQPGMEAVPVVHLASAVALRDCHDEYDRLRAPSPRCTRNIARPS